MFCECGTFNTESIDTKYIPKLSTIYCVFFFAVLGDGASQKEDNGTPAGVNCCTQL